MSQVSGSTSPARSAPPRFARERAARRIAAALDAGYEDAGRQVFLRTRDLSERGVYLWAAEPPAVGEKARVLIELPGVQAIQRLRGTVVRREADAPSGFALRFDEPALEALRALRGFVEDSERGGAEA
ncbi:MAG TPA: PilZ domain-containing protein [Myxococcota bacterium]|nr:PilZ domain-containing protein [Myxococcota bacterium]